MKTKESKKPLPTSATQMLVQEVGREGALLIRILEVLIDIRDLLNKGVK